MSVLFELAKRVRKGVALLDKKVPNWRKVMRKNDETFNIRNGECCILGTLEHKRALRKLGKPMSSRFYRDNGYERAERILHIEGSDYGFNTIDEEDLIDLEDPEQSYDEINDDAQFEVLQELWRAEFMR